MVNARCCAIAVGGTAGVCSGQSNMWLPVANSFSRNKTVAAVKAGKFANVRLMAGSSGTTVYTNKVRHLRFWTNSYAFLGLLSTRAV